MLLKEAWLTTEHLTETVSPILIHSGLPEANQTITLPLWSTNLTAVFG
jgi:hypothetical protein